MGSNGTDYLVDDDTRWVDTKTMMKILGVSKSTLYRKIDNDEVSSRKVGNTRLFSVSSDIGFDFETIDIPNSQIDTDTTSTDFSTSSVYDDRYIKKLEQENDYLKKQVDNLQLELSDTRKRTDTILMTFTSRLEKKLLEDDNKPFWKRWFN